MSQISENKLLDLQEILQILRNQAQSIPHSSTSTRYLRALDSLQASLAAPHWSDKSQDSAAGLSQGETENPYCGSAANTEPTAPILRAPLADTARSANINLRPPLTDWLITLWLTATPFATASLYLDIIAALYNSAAKAGILPKSTLFSQLKTELKTLGPDGWKKGIDDEIFERALRLTRNASHLIADDHTAAALVIWSLTHSLQPLEEIALLKKSDILSIGDSEKGEQRTENENFIINHLSLGGVRKQYLFPLRQSQRTPKQLRDHIAKIVNALFRRARLPQATDPFDTVESLWAYAALRAGIPASTLLTHLGHVPLGIPVLRLSHAKPQRKMCADGDEEQVARDLCSPASDLVSSKENFAALREIGKIFLENPPQWYAMSLRPGVRYTQVCRRIQLLNDILSDIELFYPSEEITRVIGKKIVVRQRPFIHSVVFFRAKLTDIGRLFARIGDLAWCYRQSARPGAPYAHISDAQFHLFQQTIARFTPDYQVAPLGELELNQGDRVEILGGLFTGQEATVEESKVKGQEPRVKNQESRTKSQELRVKSQGTSIRKTENATDSGVIYRLNIIGDNGIEWRINLDSRLLKQKNC